MSQQVEQTSKVTLDQLQYFWMPSGLPCFVADRDNICDIVEDFGFNIYYLLANKKTVKIIQNNTTKPPVNSGYSNNATIYNYSNTQPAQVITYNSSLFKVINNFVGRVVELSDDELPETFFTAEETCEYNMPALPHTLIDKMDQFFRLVYSQHGTESIVLLTYDMNKTGPEGWGVLVPEQSNTAAHCKYDADSIALIKPEDVLIVGSVHSHPEMSAYASGTDHADQADFDGLHITYGWQKSQNNGATQYHLELQMAGTAYSLKPEDVFEDYTFQKEPDPDVVEWSGKVKKALPPLAGGTTPLALAQAQLRQPTTKTTYSQSGTTPTAGGTVTPSSQNLNWKQMVEGLEPQAIVIVEVDLQQTRTSICPSCDFDLDTPDVNAGYCCSCDVPVISNSDSIFKIAYNYSKYCERRNLDSLKTIPYLYGESEKEEMFLMKLNLEQELKDLHSNDYAYEKDSDYVYLAEDDPYDSIYDINGTKTICCNIPMEDFVSDCLCKPAILFEDLTNFEEQIRDTEIYAEGTTCNECVHYYNATCPAFRSALTTYVNQGSTINLDQHRNTIIPCENYHSLYASFESTGVKNGN
jgi:hypothetical protein